MSYTPRRAKIWKCPDSYHPVWNVYVPIEDGPYQPCAGCGMWDWLAPTWKHAVDHLNHTLSMFHRDPHKLATWPVEWVNDEFDDCD